MDRVCPICGKHLDVEHAQGPLPFCSARCKKVDLYRWFNEEYRISEPLPTDGADELDSLGEPSQRGALS